MSDGSGSEPTSTPPNVPTVEQTDNLPDAPNNTEAVMAPLQPSSEESSDLDELPIARHQLISSAPSSVAGSEITGSRCYEDLLEKAKKLNDSADKLWERVCRLHCAFADIILKGTTLVGDPSIVQMVHSEVIPGTDLPDPSRVHFELQAVDEQYNSLIQRLETRPPPTGF